jgi:hypothetical protein
MPALSPLVAVSVQHTGRSNLLQQHAKSACCNCSESSVHLLQPSSTTNRILTDSVARRQHAKLAHYLERECGNGRSDRPAPQSLNTASRSSCVRALAAAVCSANRPVVSKSLSRALASSVWLEKWSTGESHLLLLLLLLLPSLQSLLLSTVTTVSVRSSLAEVALLLCAAAAGGVCLKKSAYVKALPLN